MRRSDILGIVFGYALIAGLYILFSDRLLYALAPDASSLQWVSIAKGLCFVAVTALTLWWLMQRLQSDEQARYQALVENHQAVMLLIDPADGTIVDCNRSAAELGLDDNVQRGLRVAGAMHDVGKVSVPTEILTKPGRLTRVEFELVKEYAEQGYRILCDVDFPWPVAEVAYQHHERLDGSGYPRGLKGDEILLEARITAVADVVESMSSHRPYRPSRGIEEALTEITQGRATRYDPVVVDACLRLFRDKGFTLPV